MLTGLPEQTWMWTPPPMMHSWGLPMQRCVIALLWGRSPVSARCAFAFRCQGNHCRRPQAHSRQITRDSRSMPRWARAQQTRTPLPVHDEGGRCRTSGCPLTATRWSCTNSNARFVMAPRTVCSSHWTFWPAWQPWYRAHGLISSAITACSHLTRVIARCWWRKRPCVHPADLMSPRLTPPGPR